ncbi:MAG: hypothetical protein KDK91_20800 [Gammaproteobacteria bacterium]|nr:hypothetical protein [Gammaproteobacteria bacterium]
MAATAQLDPTRPVRVFRNWKQHCYSIMQDGVLHASARELSLRDVRFVVRESGRKRMLDGQPKNVHAYAVGLLVDHVHPADDRKLPGFDGPVAFYDPFRFGHFADRDTFAPVHAAQAVRLDERGIVYQQVDPSGMSTVDPLAAAA